MGGVAETETSLDELPDVLPIFPLPGVLLLPRGKLPLNIFEPRYRAMTQDAMDGTRLIGMVQPSDPAAPLEHPDIYKTGCAGRITAFEPTEDGRFLITLTGIARFDVRDELPLVKGYRRVRPDWQRFGRDLAPDGGAIDRQRLLDALRLFFRLHGISADWQVIQATPDERLVNTLAMICPFQPSEKQALLEAEALDERAAIMTALMEMAVTNIASGGDGQPASRH
jgi:Lon protease-like protein